MNTAEDIEARMRQALDGKFYNTDGRDAHEERRAREAMRLRDQEIAENMKRNRRRALMARNAAKIELAELRKISNQITPRRILVAVSYAHGVPIADILGPSRNRKIVYARQHACHVMRHMAKMAYPKIGDELARDHTTALHSTETWEHIKQRFPNEVACVVRMLIDE